MATCGYILAVVQVPLKEAKDKFAELGRRAKAGETIVVSRSQGSMRLTADTATIHVKDSSFERMEAAGNPVNLRYKPAVDKPEILGTSQRVEYNVGNAKVVMSGNARLVQGQDVFTGDRMEYDLKGDVVRARGAGTNGRIQFTIQPRGQSALPAAKKP